MKTSVFNLVHAHRMAFLLSALISPPPSLWTGGFVNRQGVKRQDQGGKQKVSQAAGGCGDPTS